MTILRGHTRATGLLLRAAILGTALLACCLAVVFTVAPAMAQVTVQTGKQLQIPEPGATAAVSLNTGIATAAIANNRLTITGISPGDVRVVALYPSNIAEVRVHIVLAPPVYPPGFVAPAYHGNGSGSLEVRFSSDRMQIENVLDLATQGMLGTSRLHLLSATLPEDSGSRSFLPSAYYRITSPHLDFTVLDQTVDDSPLTLENVVLRGLHLRYRRWSFHGGYTTSAAFADVLVPVQKELAAGISYSQPFGRFFHLVPHAYFLRSIDLQDGRQRSVLFGSVLFRADFSENWRFEAEVAAGRGTGFAAGLEHYGTTSSLRATLSRKSIDFPAVRSSSLPGLNGELAWSQAFTPRIGLVAGASVDHTTLGHVKQDTGDAYGTLRYKFRRFLSIGSGVSYQSFSSPGSYASKTLTLPQQINFDRTAFGLGYQYQFATTSHSFSHGNGQRQTLRLDVRRFQIGEFIDLQTDAVGVQSFSSQLPQLQGNLQRQALVAATPDELSALLRSAASLEALGVAAQAKLLTVPRRFQEGGSVAWNSRGSRPHQVSISAFSSRSRYAGRMTSDYSISGSYAKELGTGNQFQFSASAVQSSLSGEPQMKPVVSFSFRHLLSRSPEILAADRGFSLSGTVFIDSRGGGVYEDGMDSVPQVTIVLDGKRSMVTNSMGSYYFSAVSSGPHRVQMLYTSGRAHYFTTPQDQIVDAGAVVNFGIHLPANDLWGYVQGDAGEGLADIMLVVSGPLGTVVVSTDKSGKFSIADVAPGPYQIAVDLESVPIGYATEDLAPVQVRMTSSSSSHPLIRIPAVRTLSGSVTMYDAAAGQYLPVKGATISLVAFNRSADSSSLGKFTLGGLPPGEIAVRVTAGGASLTQTIYVPSQACTIREDYKVSSLDGRISGTLKGVTLDSGR